MELKPDMIIHPSFFEWPLLRRMVEYGMSLVSFDQGRTGHSRRKPTSLLTNLRHLEDLADPVEGGLEERMKASRSWARWSSGLVKAIGLALNLQFGGRAHFGLAKMDVEEWKRHIKQEHVPYRRECGSNGFLQPTSANQKRLFGLCDGGGHHGSL